MVGRSRAFRPRARAVTRPAALFALMVLVGLALSGAIDPLQSGALTMLPALALAAMMLTRPYVGERAIARLRARRLRPAHPARRLIAPRRAPMRVVRGGRLIALALAGRAPPLAFAGCR
jgi:hypothetical protein